MKSTIKLKGICFVLVKVTISEKYCKHKSQEHRFKSKFYNEVNKNKAPTQKKLCFYDENNASLKVYISQMK